MTAEEKMRFWTAVGVIATVIGVLFGIYIYIDTKQQQKANLKVPTHRYSPSNYKSPTVIPVSNEGSNEALIHEVILYDWRWIKTPQRESRPGEGPTIPININYRDYIKAQNQFVYHLRPPRAIPGHQYSYLNVAIIEPDWVGKTFVGIFVLPKTISFPFL